MFGGARRDAMQAAASIPGPETGARPTLKLGGNGVVARFSQRRLGKLIKECFII